MPAQGQMSPPPDGAGRLVVELSPLVVGDESEVEDDPLVVGVGAAVELVAAASSAAARSAAARSSAARSAAARCAAWASASAMMRVRSSS